jgi:thrombospondin type 3 repeat protein
LVAKAVVSGQARSYLLNAASGNFQSDRATQPALTDGQLRALANANGQQVTYTCVPPGEGVRLGLDRDGDGIFDQDEIDAGTDPANPQDPFHVTPTPSPTPTATPIPIGCPCDCNNNGAVTVDEIIQMVNIALGNAEISTCTAGDTNGDGAIAVNEIIAGVINALNTCPVSPSSRNPSIRVVR